MSDFSLKNQTFKQKKS